MKQFYVVTQRFGTNRLQIKQFYHRQSHNAHILLERKDNKFKRLKNHLWKSISTVSFETHKGTKTKARNRLAKLSKEYLVLGNYVLNNPSNFTNFVHMPDCLLILKTFWGVDIAGIVIHYLDKRFNFLLFLGFFE